jgi:hypothetical protein
MSLKEIINNIPRTDAKKPANEDLMQDEEYRASCQEVINEALEKGFDVIQMENGDIITTGTQIIVTQYRWNDADGKMEKISSKKQTSNS